MKITKAISLADILAPNKLPAEIKVQYINEAEGMVALDVMRLATADVPVYGEDELDSELLAVPPYDKLYVDYLVAMIHFANGETNKYANCIEKFNESIAEFHAFFFERYHPADGGMINEGYYITAYGIVVKHGYKGTEDEFADMLINGGGGGGGSGQDGVSPVISVTKSGKVTTITIEDVEGVKVTTINDGKDGRGIVGIDRTSGNGAAGTTDIYTISYTDGTTSAFAVYNGANGSGGGGSGGGENGATFTPYVDASGNLTWTNDKGLPNPATVNIKGSKGDKGDKGDNGVSATHSWSGTRLTVTSASGTSSADLKGDKGDKGDDYTLTDADKDEIAQIAAGLIDVPGGGGGGATLELVWENADPGAHFRQQTVMLQKSYDKVLVVLHTPDTDYGGTVSTTTGVTYAFLNAADNDAIYGTYSDYDGDYPLSGLVRVSMITNQGKLCYRELVLYTSGNQMYVYNAYSLNTYGDSPTSNVTSALIPVRIYGIA